MHFIYDDSSVRTPYASRVPFNELDALRYWGNHFANSLELAFFLKNGDTHEKLRASHELSICDKKMNFWKKHPNFDSQQAAVISQRLKKNWSATP